MSELGPITAELRELMGGVEPRVDEDGVVTAKYVTPEAWGEFVRRCDAIDAVHAALERENAELRERLAALDESADSMHDGGSITDELRKYANRFKNSHDAWSGIGDDLTAIADRIDAEHQKAIRELNNLADASVLLPVDADGECIHIGDVMEWVRYEDDDTTIVRNVAAVGADVFFAWSDEQGRYAQYKAHAYRHHHAPTVEYAAKLRLAGDAE